ncbi:hypothetical protein [Stenotrophomonas maltophilia]|uniref:hypothetical protein n=1 Tax=Stenotrophomonas maltophilia TaxID=40324 RepID=UPI00066EED34|nr:hypothetical protein [Stenotrophomonas maltophilia]
MTMLKAYAVNDSDLYAAATADEAVKAYLEHCGEDVEVEAGYPIELSDADIDKPIPAFDEDEQPTGEMTSIRQFLAEHGDQPGFLASSDY